MNNEDNNKLLSDEELDDVTGGKMTAVQKAGVIAGVKLAKVSGYTLDDMEYIFDAARRAFADGDKDVTAEELEAFIRKIWDRI